MGVAGVSHQISIKPSASGAVVQGDFEAALKRHATVDARTISVAVHGHDVTLSGTVHHWDERDAAVRAAWSSPGVQNVVDMMTLAQWRSGALTH